MAKNKAAKTKAADEGSMRKLLRDIVVILILVLGIHSCVAKPFYIPSDSMMPILRNGDRLIVSKYPYGWSYASVSFHLAPKKPGRWFGKLPERGDIVVLEHPVTRVDYIKRVIGLPGDTIELRGGALIINGKPIKREVQPMLSVPVDSNMPGSDSSLGPRRHRQGSSRTADRARDAARRCDLRHDRHGAGLSDRRLRADHGASRPPVPDGRQSRRQRRQPRASRPQGAWRPGAVRRDCRPGGDHQLFDRRYRRMV
jgi:signal peptidase I